MLPKLAQTSLIASLFVSLFGSLLIFNVKSLLLLLILAACLLFFIIQKSFFESSVLLFFIFLPLENTFRQWPIYLSGVESLTTYTQFFGITPKIVFGLLLIFLLFSQSSSANISHASKPAKILITFYLLSAISTLSIAGRSVFLITGFISLSIAILYFLLSHDYFQSNRHGLFMSIIVIFSIFSSYIGVRQFIKQQQLGLYVELTPRFSPSGYTTTDGDRQYRVSGFISHPVYFGSFLCILLPLILSLVFSSQQSSRKLTFFYSVLAFSLVITILGTNSRTTWINLAIIALSFITYQYHQKHKANSTTFKWIGVGLLAITIIIIPKLSTRAESIQELLSNQKGSLYSRISLIKHSITTITTHPLTGVGLNNFPFFSSSNSITNSFSAPPHSTILIFFSELGIPTTLVFIYFLWTLLYPTSNPFEWSIFKYSLWVSLLTFIVSSQFHPLFNLDPTFHLFMFTAGIFSQLCQKPSV
jgi:hypothetical protein